MEVAVRDYGMTAEHQDELWSRWRAGESLARIGRGLGIPVQHVRRFLTQTGGVRSPAQRRSSRVLSTVEREEISRGVATGESLRLIAGRLRRPPSTICREVARNGGRDHYRAAAADQQAYRRARRPKPGKLAVDHRLRAVVEDKLGRRWSPQQIAGWLSLAYPDEATMRVSHETIYLSLFVQARGALRRDLRKCLRTGRAMRYPRSARMPQGRGRLTGMVPISQRPAEVTDRAVPGHWEGDLLLGRRPSVVATLVERSSRYLQLVALPAGCKAEQVRPALATSIAQLPRQLRRSLTWDQGKEMAEHVQFAVQAGVQVYFCDPNSPWQRGSNENTNGLLRQYLAKGADLRRFDQEQLDAIAAELNGRPRQTLGWKTPSEVFTEAVAATS